MKKRERQQIEWGTKLVSIRIRCGKLKKSVVIPWKDCKIDAYDQECDLCGSHGSKSIVVKCVCGLEHDIEVDSW